MRHTAYSPLLVSSDDRGRREAGREAPSCAPGEYLDLLGDITLARAARAGAMYDAYPMHFGQESYYGSPGSE